MSESPEFNRKQFQTSCMNTAKTSRLSGNDMQCNGNIEKLLNECDRLSALAKKSSGGGGGVQMEKYHQETSDNLQQTIQELKSKRAEVAYLEAQLKRKDEENEKLRFENRRLMKNSGAAGDDTSQMS